MLAVKISYHKPMACGQLLERVRGKLRFRDTSHLQTWNNPMSYIYFTVNLRCHFKTELSGRELLYLPVPHFIDVLSVLCWTLKKIVSYHNMTVFSNNIKMFDVNHFSFSMLFSMLNVGQQPVTDGVLVTVICYHVLFIQHGDRKVSLFM